MFNITLSPIVSERTLELSVKDKKITINGVEESFADLPVGEEVVFNSLDENFNPVGRQNSDVIGAVKNIDDVIHITILLPILSTEKREEVCYPEQIHVKKNGRVSLPNDTQNN